MFADSKFTDVDGVGTHYWETGSGAPLLLLHGSGPGVSAQANWRLALPALGTTFKVIAPDLIGFGETESKAPLHAGLDLWVGHVEGFMRALGIERCLVVGNSMGGAVALGLAARYPEMVERLVTMGTVGISFPITDALDQVWGYQPDRDVMRRLIRLFTSSAAYAEDEGLVELRYRTSAEPRNRERYEALFPAPRQRWVEALALSPEELANIHCPVLMIHGKDDRVIPWETTSLALLDILADARLALLPRCGHWVQIERPDDFHSLVTGFLR